MIDQLRHLRRQVPLSLVTFTALHDTSEIVKEVDASGMPGILGKRQYTLNTSDVLLSRPDLHAVLQRVLGKATDHDRESSAMDEEHGISVRSAAVRLPTPLETQNTDVATYWRRRLAMAAVAALVVTATLSASLSWPLLAEDGETKATREAVPRLDLGGLRDVGASSDSSWWPRDSGADEAADEEEIQVWRWRRQHVRLAYLRTVE